MTSIGDRSFIKAAVCATLATLSAWADQPASLIIYEPHDKPWTIGISDTTYNPGKVKIFDHKPQYGTDGKLLAEPHPMVAQLRNAEDSFDLKSTQREYWLVYYPKLAALNLTLDIYHTGEKPTEGAHLTVTQAIMPDQGKAGLIFAKGFTLINSLPGVATVTGFLGLGDKPGRVTLDIKGKPSASCKPIFQLSNFEKADTAETKKNSEDSALFVLK